MAEKLFLFDLSKDSLADNLAICGTDLDALLSSFAPPGFSIPPGPSNNPWRAVNRDDSVDTVLPSAGLGYGIPLLVPTRAQARNLIEQMRQKADAAGDPEAARVIGVDLAPVSMSLSSGGHHWCAGEGLGDSFGTRRRALHLIDAQALVEKELRGQGVRVFVVDQGFDRGYLQQLGGTYGGGMAWIADGQIKVPGDGSWPYTALRQRHGSMMLRSVVSLAPDAEYLDLPLIPSRITAVDWFALRALFAFAFLNFFFLNTPGPWVIVNAWGVVSRFGEAIRGGYTNNRNHFLNLIISAIGQKHDVVFAAGNNGQFSSDLRVPGYDRGPGRSVFGANGLPEVTSVGAVRSDTTWVGTASQGPGAEDFEIGVGVVEKPDFAAPSWFLEDGDAMLLSSGTSAASAVAAGAVAALRQNWDTATVNPAAMRTILRETARPMSHPGWNDRTGTGVLHLREAIEQLGEA